jgi:CPA2 family monovalent cation:H+ antiporter-2
MFLTPLVSGFTGPLYKLRNRWLKPFQLHTINLPQNGLHNHLVIAGGGRVGKYIADVLYRIRMPFVILEINYSRVEQIKSLGFPVIYGDASQSIILEAAEIDKAKLLLITTPVTIVSRAIVSQVKKLDPGTFR